MRNVIAMSLVAFIVLTAGGYGISWYAQASATEQNIKAFIDKLNENQKTITYESIESSGFPSNVFVSIVKPRFQGRIDQLLGSTANPPKEWLEDAMLDGKITVGINALSDQYTLTISGNVIENTTIGGQTTSSTKELIGNIACALQFKRDVGIFDTLWNFKSLNRGGNELAKDFRMLDCNTSGYKTTDTASKELLSSMGTSRLYLTHSPENDSSQLRLYMKLMNALVTPLGDDRMLNMIQVISPDYSTPIKFSAYGNQNFDFDFTYFGPKDYNPANKNPLIDVALNKFEITNNIYNYHMDFHFNNTPATGSRVITLSFKNEASFTEQYDTSVQNMARNFIHQISTIKDPKYQQTQALFKQYTPDQLYSIIYPAIPSLHTLGKITLAADGAYHGTDDMLNGDYAVNVLEISTTPYGIVSKASLKTGSNALPSGTVEISCSNCLQMIDDMVAYSGKIHKVMLYFNPQGAKAYLIPPEQTAAIKKFLSLLAIQQPDPANKSTLAYVISGAGMNITVNNKSMNDVMRLYNEYIRPTLKQTDASAGAN